MNSQSIIYIGLVNVEGVAINGEYIYWTSNSGNSQVSQSEKIDDSSAEISTVKQLAPRLTKLIAVSITSLGGMV